MDQKKMKEAFRAAYELMELYPDNPGDAEFFNEFVQKIAAVTHDHPDNKLVSYLLSGIFDYYMHERWSDQS